MNTLAKLFVVRSLIPANQLFDFIFDVGAQLQKYLSDGKITRAEWEQLAVYVGQKLLTSICEKRGIKIEN